jgi:hypothetical protein
MAECRYEDGSPVIASNDTNTNHDRVSTVVFIPCWRPRFRWLQILSCPRTIDVVPPRWERAAHCPCQGGMARPIHFHGVGPRRTHVRLLRWRGLLPKWQECKLPTMPPLDLGKFAPVTLGHMRSQGCRELLAYCKSGRCKHSAIMDVGHLPDDTPIKSLGDGVVCSRCGHVGADVLPNWRAQYDTVDAEFHALSLRSGPWKPER